MTWNVQIRIPADMNQRFRSFRLFGFRIRNQRRRRTSAGYGSPSISQPATGYKNFVRMTSFQGQNVKATSWTAKKLAPIVVRRNWVKHDREKADIRRLFNGLKKYTRREMFLYAIPASLETYIELYRLSAWGTAILSNMKKSERVKQT